MSTPIILDCDPGHDDAVAILLAVASPEIDLLAVTTCFGNCSIEDATRNAMRILTLAGATDVPVAQGADRPLEQALELGNYVHGKSGLDGPEMPEPAMMISSLSAVEMMQHVISSSAVPVTMVVTGPMTNMAQLLRVHPNAAQNISEIVFMGGSTERGNHTPSAEFNTFADPEALAEVIVSGIPLRMVGLNLTHQALAVTSVVERMQSMDSAIGKTCAEWMGFFGTSYRSVWSFEAPPVHDPCTIAALIDPTLISWVDTHLEVELEGKWTRGETIVDLHNRLNLKPNAKVAITLDTARYWDLVLDAIERLGADSK
jgi:purine nucleosidase/pyrimidine-specific ribonucleoside hydrolase|tara:strand:+ start:3618 stop:4562 length:945 start_codon:yes stop_codon:yes gene_type:complete